MIKAAIVALVFPTLAWVIIALFGLVLHLASLLLPASWQSAVASPIRVISLLVGLIGAALISRQIWPEEERAIQW